MAQPVILYVEDRPMFDQGAKVQWYAPDATSYQRRHLLPSMTEEACEEQEIERDLGNYHDGDIIALCSYNDDGTMTLRWESDGPNQTHSPEEFREEIQK